ncbi:hypothetical protein [Sorangium sp. So ce1182]|uniref:hypothetical protein n=1 Tax=Sorangium sp. So ce1182 TaxID=3133334 RepID=UPI003F5D87E6
MNAVPSARRLRLPGRCGPSSVPCTLGPPGKDDSIWDEGKRISGEDYLLLQ